ncbi:unnamed protein product [Closterium sp. Naga37s-1]|nr:unnamed protein product [Closterium sp. Naga37s-1]
MLLMLLISPFFFWGSSMVAMKDVLPKAGPMFVASIRLIPAGLLLVAFAASRGRPMPKSALAWLSILLFALVDATAFQPTMPKSALAWFSILLFALVDATAFQVIIDSQPLTVAVLAALLFGETISKKGALGLVLGVVGLLLLERYHFQDRGAGACAGGCWLTAARGPSGCTSLLRFLSLRVFQPINAAASSHSPCTSVLFPMHLLLTVPLSPTALQSSGFHVTGISRPSHSSHSFHSSRSSHSSNPTYSSQSAHSPHASHASSIPLPSDQPSVQSCTWCWEAFLSSIFPSSSTIQQSLVALLTFP